jgi:hypothetical protein
MAVGKTAGAMRQKRHTRSLRGTPAAVAVISLGVALFCALTIHQSGAILLGTSENAGNLFRAGAMDLSNSKEGTAVINAVGLAPGGSANGTLTISVTGDYSAQVMLTGSGDSSALAEALILTIHHIPATGTPVTLWNGTLSSFSTCPLGTFAPGTSKKYGFTVTLPATAPTAALNSTTTKSLRFAGVAQ